MVERVARLDRWAGQGGEAHQLMVVLACAARHECDIDEPDGPTEFIELDAEIADKLNDLLGDLRDCEPRAAIAALTTSPEPPKGAPDNE
jgi:hypothetical protein